MPDTISLEKGQSVNLSKASNEFRVGLGWSPRATSGDDFDLDASVLLLGADNKVRDDDDFIFYGNKKLKQNDGKIVAKDGSVVHEGDNLTGEGDGDDEVVHIYTDSIDQAIQKAVIVASIYAAHDRKQNFGMVDDAYIRVIDEATGEEIKFLLGEDAGTCHTVIMGTLYRDPSDPTGWKYKAVGQGFDDELGDVAKLHGVVF